MSIILLRAYISRYQIIQFVLFAKIHWMRALYVYEKKFHKAFKRVQNHLVVLKSRDRRKENEKEKCFSVD